MRQGCGKANFWGSLIKELRLEYQMSQRRLALEVGINRSTLRRVEAGDARNEIDVIEKLLGHFGYELEALHRRSILEDHRRRYVAASDPIARSQQAVASLMSLPPDMLQVA